MTEHESVKELENQAKNTKYLMDRLNKAYLGMTTDELFEAMLRCAGTGGRNDNRNTDTCGGGGAA